MRLNTGLEAAPVSAGLQVALGLAPGSLALQAIDHVLAPVLAVQRELLAALFDRQAHALGRQLRRVERERADYVHNRPFPEPSTLAEFDEEVARLRCLLRPVVVLEDNPGRLYNAFGRSPDEAVFLVSTKAGSAKALLQFWGAQRGRLERELVEAAVTGQPYTAALLDNPAKRALASPLLSMVLVSDFATLQEWMTSPGVAAVREAPSFIALDAGGHDTRLNPAAGSPQHADAWEGLVRRLFRCRLAGSRQVATLTPAVRDHLVGVLNGLAARPPQGSETEAAEPRRALGQALLIMLLLHACGPRPDRPVALDTAHKAGLLTAWLHGHQLALKRKAGAIDPLASFVQERVVREKKSALTLEEVHRAAQDYFVRQGLTPPPFLRFRSRIAPLVRTHLSTATSHSVRGPDGKQQVGWNNVALRSGPMEPNRWLTA